MISFLGRGNLGPLWRLARPSSLRPRCPSRSSPFFVTDLTAAGLTVIEPARVEEAFNQRQFRLAHPAEEQVDSMKVGRTLGTDIIVFLEVVSGRRAGTCGEPPCQIHYSPFVSARAFSTETGHVLWSGRAHSNTTEPHLNAEIMGLTHEAISHGIVGWSSGSGLRR